jgi:hypothetical protein
MKNWIAHLSTVLLLVSVIVVGSGVVQLASVPMRVGEQNERQVLRDLKELAPLQLQTQVQYEKDFSQHALFYVPEKKVVVKGPGLKERLINYSLIGIVRGAQPEAIIENKKRKQTYFIRSGETFDRMDLTEIKTHGVVVGFKGETEELQLEG